MAHQSEVATTSSSLQALVFEVAGRGSYIPHPTVPNHLVPQQGRATKPNRQRLKALMRLGCGCGNHHLLKI